MSVPMNVKPILVLVLKLGWRCPMRTWDWTDSPFSPAPRPSAWQSLPVISRPCSLG